MGGFHLISIPNGSFESGGATPDQWVPVGPRHHVALLAPSVSAGTMSRIDLGQADVPTRGRYAMRLTTGDGSTASIGAVSDPIPITPGTTYTTAMALRFVWSGDPNPSAAPESRPNVYVAFDYLDARGSQIAADVTRYFQENSTSGFATFVFHYTPPADAQTVRIEIGAHRNGLAQPITVDADALR